MNESYALSNLQETQLPKVENACSMGWHSMSNKGERKKVRGERITVRDRSTELEEFQTFQYISNARAVKTFMYKITRYHIKS